MKDSFLAQLHFTAEGRHNKSMDVRAKQRLSYHVAWLLSAGLMAVSPHVISIVMPLHVILVTKWMPMVFYCKAMFLWNIL